MKRKIISQGADEIFAACLITFAFAVFGYEKHMPESFMNIWNLMMFIVFIATWTYLSFKNGYLKKRTFPIFTAIFWTFPNIIIFLADNGLKFLRILSDFCNLLIVVPSEFMGNILEIPSPISVIVLFIYCIIGYGSGMLLSVILHQHSNRTNEK